MEVILASHAGSCYGVQRALDIASEVLERETSAATLGQIIHNPIVVSNLASRGLAPVDSLDEVSCDTVVIRSHGITPRLENEIRARGFAVVDATCPHVARAQKGAAALAAEGKHVLVVGEVGHPEVESLVAYAQINGASVSVVSSADEIPNDIKEPVGVVVQTTQTKEVLFDVLAALDERGITPEVKNTICSATRDRQKSAAELAEIVDAMVIIGGKNSSNTTRLAEICAASCEHVFHIESADELAAFDFSNFARVGVTAGASTPQEQIDSVTATLEGRGCFGGNSPKQPRPVSENSQVEVFPASETTPSLRGGNGR